MTVGKNKGKKYVKLQGWEEATPQSESRAKAFMDWYGDNFDRLRDKLIFSRLYDDELATDTALMVYDNIALKQFVVVDFQAYFLRAYHTNRIAKAKRRVYEDSVTEFMVTMEERTSTETAVRGEAEFEKRYAATHKITDTPAFDYEQYEQAVYQLQVEMLDYVRANYDPLSVSLFEIYTGLLPDTSYKRMSAMLGISETRIWTSIGAIRKDLVLQFQSRKDFLLSLV